MKKLKKLSILLAAISITTTIGTSTANAATGNAFNIKDSKLSLYSSLEEVQNLIDDLDENAVTLTKKDFYVKVSQDENGDRFEKTYTEKEYLKEQLKENSVIMPFDLPTEQNFGWIKLRLEAYQKSGTKNITVAGFYEWLRVPFFSGYDTFAIGHDATITFNNQSCFGAFISPEHDSVLDKNIDKVQRVDRSNAKAFKSDVSGVAYKFRLGSTQGIPNPDDRFPSPLFDNGMMYVEGTVLNHSGNLQLSYGHAEIALNYDINNAITFLTTGAITFDIVGSQDKVTIGDRVVLK